MLLMQTWPTYTSECQAVGDTVFSQLSRSLFHSVTSQQHQEHTCLSGCSSLQLSLACSFSAGGTRLDVEPSCFYITITFKPAAEMAN